MEIESKEKDLVEKRREERNVEGMYVGGSFSTGEFQMWDLVASRG